MSSWAISLVTCCNVRLTHIHRHTLFSIIQFTTNNSTGASLNSAPDNTVLNQPLNPPRSNQDHHTNYNNPAPPVDPHSIFGSPVGNQQPLWNNHPVFPIQTQRTPPFPQQPYPQIPQYQPMPQYPYGAVGGGGQTPYQLPPQQPYAFGNPPPVRNYPSYYTTTKEPSLWNQFLYNKQGGKKNGASASTLISGILIALSALSVIILH